MPMTRSGKITKEEIPAKIKKLMAENYSQDQAIAIALGMWREIADWVDSGMDEDEAIVKAIREWQERQPMPIWEAEGRHLWPVRSARAVTLVDGVEGIIHGYLAIWGSPTERDSYDTWFDRQRPPEMDLDLLPIALRYEHGMDGVITNERIGEIYKVWFDDVGIPYEARLDKSSPFFERVVAEIQHGTPDGALRTSSGTVNYLADFYEDGAFKFWPVAEGSLTAVPAEPRMLDVELIRSNNQPISAAPGWQTAVAGLIAESEEPTIKLEKGTDHNPNEQTEPMEVSMDLKAIMDSLPDGYTLEDMFAAMLAAEVPYEDMDKALKMLKAPEEEQALAIPPNATDSERFAAALSAVMAKKEVAAQAQAVKENRALKSEVAMYRAMQAQPPAARSQPQGDSTGGGNGKITNMHDLRYDHLSAKEMALGYIICRSKYRQGMEAYNRPVSEDFYRALRAKAIEKVERGPAGYHDVNNFAAARSAAYRANEIMGTGSASQEGYDWITIFYPSQLWEVARAGRIMSELESAGLWTIEVPDGAHSATVMLEGSDPTWYTAAANATVDTTTLTSLPLVTQTQALTANTSVTPGKLMVRILVDTELIEDSIIPTLPQLNRQLEESAQNEVEYAFLNADSDGTINTNINLIDGTPASAPSSPHYMLTNGALKYALVTGSSTSRDGSTFSSGDFLATQKLLPAANAADPEKLLFISDISTRLKALEFTDVKTLSERADGGTIETGRINVVYGVKYLASAQMALANSSGKIPTAGGTLGRLLCVYPQYWAMVWKRQITFKQAEDIEGDVTKIVGSLRLAFQARGAGAATVSYNLTV